MNPDVVRERCARCPHNHPASQPCPDGAWVELDGELRELAEAVRTVPSPRGPACGHLRCRLTVACWRALFVACLAVSACLAIGFLFTLWRLADALF